MNKTNEDNKLTQLAYLYNEKFIFPCHDTKFLSNYGVEIRPISQTIIDERRVTIVRVACFDRAHGEEVKWEGPLNKWYTACAEVVDSHAEKVRYY